MNRLDMEHKKKNQGSPKYLKIIAYFAGFSGILFLTFFIGYYISLSYSSIGIILTIFLIPVLLTLNNLLVYLFMKKKGITRKHKIIISIYFSINQIFSFIIGLTIPLMESISRNNYALVMLPLLVLINYILIRRILYYMEQENTNLTNRENNNTDLELETIKRPIIEFEGKKYTYSPYSLLLLAIGAPLLALAIYFFFDWEINYWLHELVVKQTTFLLNSLFNMGVSNSYLPQGSYHWNFNIPSRGTIYFETFCTGIQAICIFAGIIFFTPHSKDRRTNRDIIWRKTKSLIISSAIFYLVNILRMVIQIYLYYIGYAWSDIHYSISAASSFIAAIIVLLLHKWIPEFIISLIWVYSLIKQKVKKNSENTKKNI
ncbi:MAG: membrane protein of unknown function [Promethearchaeota archaeon]|nr:MAG: membrane protein of unknown function [Candidatus Lokiarchaeota archaeon]